MKLKIKEVFQAAGKKKVQKADSPAIDPELRKMDEQVKRYRKTRKRNLLIGIAAAAAVLAGIFLFINLQTYTSVSTIEVYESADAGNNSYRQFGKNMLKYSRDGIALLNRKGEEVWNHSYQMENPSVYEFGQSAVVADKGGNSMLVVNEEGIKGEISTTLPIEKAVVSSQGIVAAVLNGDGEPQIVCYDAAGNILAELDTAMTGHGYPLDISLSEDGELLLVSYMTVSNGRTVTNVYYYNFGKAGSKEQNNEVLSETYENMVAPTVFFMDIATSAVVGNDRILLYEGSDQPSLKTTVKLDKEIKSVFHNTEYIGLILKNEGEAGYELRLYNTNGSVVLSKKFTGDYSNVKLCGSQVIMYGGAQCCIFTRSGIRKFDGEMGETILEMIPVFGVNKYIVMNANGMEVVRLVK